MKLWVDDEREAPDASWTVAKSADEAEVILMEDRMNDPLEWVSLDYVLGRASDDYGDALLSWMLSLNIIPKKLTVHSSSSGGNELMIMIAERAGVEATVFNG